MNGNEIESKDEISELPEVSRILETLSDNLLDSHQRIVNIRYKNLYFNLLKTLKSMEIVQKRFFKAQTNMFTLLQ